jgi:tripartite-type tricarboxylate transporter receptor subunit TctC
MRPRWIGAAFSIAMGLVNVAHAQTFPTRPVTLVVPFPAGGSTDVTLRSLAAATEKHLGKPIVIENRPGANGVLSPIQMAATAAPDGYTVAQINRNVLRYPFITNTTFNPMTDLTYIIGVSGYTFGVVVKADASWRSFEEFLADTKARHGSVNYGTTGAGSSQHIIMEQIARQRGITWAHVPFKGDADSLNALLGGHIDVVAGSTAWGPLVAASSGFS